MEAVSSAPVQPPQPQVVYQEPLAGKVPGAADPPIAPKDKAGRQIVNQDVKVEYRDQNGRVLSPEKAKELKGKVKFQVSRTCDMQKSGISNNQQPTDSLRDSHTRFERQRGCGV